MRKIIFITALLAALAAAPAAAQTDIRPAPAVNVTKINGAAVATGNGTAATAQRVTLASDSTGTVTDVGNVAAGATDSGNPVKMGGVYNTTQPTLTDGQRGNLQLDSRGNFVVSIQSGAAVLATGNGLAVQPYGFSATFWSYTSGTSPILSNTTTAVTIKAAAGASVINYIDSCQIGSTALGASVPLALRDGAGGTVKFAVRAPTAGWLTPWTVNFQPPLKGTANTLWEVVTTTADTSGTYDVNCQGHTGS